MEVLGNAAAVHVEPQLAEARPGAGLGPPAEEQVVGLRAQRERRRVLAEAQVIGLVDAAVVAERVDEEVEGGLIAEADGGRGGVERADGVIDEIGRGEAVEEGAERGAEEGGVPARGVVVGEEEGGGERELEVLAEDVDGAGEGGGCRGQVGAGGGGGPVEEVERAAPVVGVEGQRLEHRRGVERGGRRGGGGGGVGGGEGSGRV